MADNLFAELHGAGKVAATGSATIFGVEIALVTNVQDPQKLGRVKVCFPRLQGMPESDWARVVQPAAGPGRGFYWLPEVHDEVLVAFEMGQANRPYVIGALWNAKDKPMKDAYADDNTTRMIQTRSGHQIVLSDKSGKEKITISDKSGKRVLTFDVKAKKLLIEAKEGTIELRAEKKVVLHCEDLEVKTGKAGKLEVGSKLDLKIASDGAMKAGSKFTLKGSQVQLNPSSLTVASLAGAAAGAAAGAVAGAATGGASGAAAGASAGAQAGAAAGGPGAGAVAGGQAGAAAGSATVPTKDVVPPRAAPSSTAAAPAGGRAPGAGAAAAAGAAPAAKAAPSAGPAPEGKGSAGTTPEAQTAAKKDQGSKEKPPAEPIEAIAGPEKMVAGKEARYSITNDARTGAKRSEKAKWLVKVLSGQDVVETIDCAADDRFTIEADRMTIKSVPGQWSHRRIVVQAHTLGPNERARVESAVVLEPIVIADSWTNPDSSGNRPGAGRDFGSGDMTVQQYRDVGVMFNADYAIPFGLGSLTDDQLFKVFRDMAVGTFSSGELVANTNAMIDKFRKSDGGEYTNEVLTRKAREHDSTKRFVTNLRGKLAASLKTLNGDAGRVSRFARIPSPVYGSFTDKFFGGLTIAVNDTWAYEVELVDYEMTGAHSYRAKVTIRIYDHFGLDKADLEGKGISGLPGFRAWLLLQRVKGYKPFITKIEFGEQFEDSF